MPWCAITMAEDEAVDHHVSPLPAKSKNLHPNTPVKFDNLLQVLDSEGPIKSRLPRSSSHSKIAGFAVYLWQPLLPSKGFSTWLRGKESACQGRRCRRLGFDPWVGKIPWRRKWPPIPVFLPGKFHGQRNLQFLGLQRVKPNGA